MKRCVRVILDAGDPHWNMTLDLVLDDKNVPKKGMPFCGWWGMLKATDMQPIVVLEDGRVDFGSDEDTDQSDRFGRINLHGRKIEPFELITYTENGDETLFRVGPMTDLLE